MEAIVQTHLESGCYRRHTQIPYPGLRPRFLEFSKALMNTIVIIRIHLIVRIIHLLAIMIPAHQTDLGLTKRRLELRGVPMMFLRYGRRNITPAVRTLLAMNPLICPLSHLTICSGKLRSVSSFEICDCVSRN